MPEKILIVDHEIVRAEVICSILLDAGYDATFECSSAGAIEKVKEFAPRLLIIDPVMPSTMGTDVAMDIFTRTKCKVLIISAGADEDAFAEVVNDLRKQGCDCDAFVLPFEKRQLLVQIRNQLGRR